MPTIDDVVEELNDSFHELLHHLQDPFEKEAREQRQRYELALHRLEHIYGEQDTDRQLYQFHKARILGYDDYCDEYKR